MFIQGYISGSGILVMGCFYALSWLYGLYIEYKDCLECYSSLGFFVHLSSFDAIMVIQAKLNVLKYIYGQCNYSTKLDVEPLVRSAPLKADHPVI